MKPPIYHVGICQRKTPFAALCWQLCACGYAGDADAADCRELRQQARLLLKAAKVMCAAHFTPTVESPRHGLHRGRALCSGDMPFRKHHRLRKKLIISEHHRVEIRAKRNDYTCTELSLTPLLNT